MGLGEEGKKAPTEVGAAGRCRVGKGGWKEADDPVAHSGACLPPALAYPIPRLLTQLPTLEKMDVFGVICHLPVPMSFFPPAPFSTPPLS